jgi:hypothetical protein
MLIIPAIDLKDGQCVRLKQGDMDQSTIFGDPAEMARRWLDAGARRLHLVDLNGAFAGQPKNLAAIKAILKEVDGESGVIHSVEQISEGTEYLTTGTSYKTANNSFYFEGVAQYNRVFGDKHDVGGLLVGYARELLTDASSDVYSSLPFRNMGISGRTTYAYDERYFVELNFGYNGSEKFSKQNR